MLKQALKDQDYVILLRGNEVNISFENREAASELFEFIGGGGLLRGMREIEATEMRMKHAREYLEFMGKKTAEFYRNHD